MSTRISAGVDDCPCFSTFYCYCMIPIDCKITKFSLYLLRIYNYTEHMHVSSKVGELVLCADVSKQIYMAIIHVIVIPRYEYDIVVITRVRGEAEYEC